MKLLKNNIHMGIDYTELCELQTALEYAIDSAMTRLDDKDLGEGERDYQSDIMHKMQNLSNQLDQIKENC